MGHKILTKEYFPESYVELMRETKNHPPLLIKMGEVNTNSFISLLEVIATYVGVVELEEGKLSLVNGSLSCIRQQTSARLIRYNRVLLARSLRVCRR